MSGQYGYGRSSGGQQQKKITNVDLVLVIDATGSMYNCIETVKENAKNLYYDLCRLVEEEGIRTIHQMRIRVIAFRDYLEYENEIASPLSKEPHVPMMATEFFRMPDEIDDFVEAINSIEAVGGGDAEEDALEALAFAMRSNWSPASPGVDRRQIIALWTDADAHEIGYGRASEVYPPAMAKNFRELEEWWGLFDQMHIQRHEKTTGYMDHTSKRLLLFAPGIKTVENFRTKEKVSTGTIWNEIYNNWDNVQWIETEEGQYSKSLEAVDRESVLYTEYTETILKPLFKTVVSRTKGQ